MWGVLGNGRDGGRRRRRRVQSPVQVPPELLLVLCVHQFIHTLVHDVRLRGGMRRESQSKLKHTYKLQESLQTLTMQPGDVIVQTVFTGR